MGNQRYKSADFDGDICLTSDNEYLINAIDETLPIITYEKTKTKEQNITDSNIANIDTKSFESPIGGITNLASNLYAMLPNFEEGTKEYNEIKKRIKLLRRFQGDAIDKTKGASYTPPPKKWSHKQKYIETPNDATDSEIERIKAENEKIKFDNSICCDRKTYFFGYVYPKHLKDYNIHKKSYNEQAINTFGMTMNELREIEDKSPEMKKFLRGYFRYQPLFNSKCSMNILARYVEDIQFDSVFKKKGDKFDYTILMSDKDFVPQKSTLKKVSETIFEFNKYYKRTVRKNSFENNNGMSDVEDDDFSDRFKYLFESFEEQMTKICSNEETIVNYIVYSYYNSYPTYTKVMLWNVYGEQIFNNVKNNSDKYYMLVDDENGTDYFGEKISLKEFDLDD